MRLTMKQQAHKDAIDALEGKEVTGFTLSQAMLGAELAHGSVVESADGKRLLTIEARDAAGGDNGAGAVDETTRLMVSGIALTTAATLGTRIRAAGGTVDGFLEAFRLTDAAEGEHLRIEEALGNLRVGARAPPHLIPPGGEAVVNDCRAARTLDGLSSWGRELEGRLGIDRLELLALDARETLTVGDVLDSLERRRALLRREVLRKRETAAFAAAVQAEAVRQSFEALGARVARAVRP